MIKVMLLMHRHPDMSHAEFSQYWRGTHGPIAKEMSQLRRYVQDHAPDKSPLGKPPCDGIAELWFDSEEALQNAFASPEGKRTIADLAEFTDTGKSGPFVVDQVDIV